MADIQIGDVVQIDAEDPVFAYCFLTVTELKSFGVQGYVQVPKHPSSVQAFYRVQSGRITRIGRAEFVDSDTAEELGAAQR